MACESPSKSITGYLIVAIFGSFNTKKEFRQIGMKSLSRSNIFVDPGRHPLDN